jgi:CheY-like chemotaxis protein
MRDQPETEAQDLPAKTILIVDDDPDTREIILDYLQAETPYQVFAAPDGFTALKIVQTVVPHLFLLDYHLGSSMTGLQLVRHLRSMKEHEQTPILLMSAQMPKEANEQPGVRTLHKPFELDDLAQLLISMLM